MGSEQIRIAQSRSLDVFQAVAELHEGLVQVDMELLIFFCSSEYDLDALAKAMERCFNGVQVVGCTTAGEITPLGLCDACLVGVSFSSSVCSAVTGYLEHLQNFKASAGYEFAQSLLQKLEAKSPHVNATNSFGFFLIDGLSVKEESVTLILQNVLGGIPIIGGSAGDNLAFQNTYVYFNGRFHNDGAVLILITTALPFKLFKTQHFVPHDERMVVTEADTSRRVVKELNGYPAAQEYARQIGVPESELDPSHFAAYPVVVIIDGGYFVRSIQHSNSDQSLTFYCAIEEGLVLRLAQGVNLLENLQETFTKVRAQIGPPQLVLCCDCILRKLEIFQKDMQEEVNAIFQSNNALGFNTYGEQFLGIHVNQTFVAVAIGLSSHV